MDDWFTIYCLVVCGLGFALFLFALASGPLGYALGFLVASLFCAFVASEPV
jgi:hypothetical protein